MATISNLTLSLVRNVANVDVTVEYDVDFTAFDQLTNLSYLDSWKLIGDDTGQDGDDAAPGDDPIPLGLVPLTFVASNGQASVHRVKTKTMAFASLDEDAGLPPADRDDEIRAVVTLTPQLPAVVTRESAAQVVLAP